MITNTFSGSESPREALNCETACCSNLAACVGVGAGRCDGCGLGLGLTPGLRLELGVGCGDCGKTTAELDCGEPGVGAGGVGLDGGGLVVWGGGLLTGTPVYAASAAV